jgi:hypothetical protein
MTALAQQTHKQPRKEALRPLLKKLISCVNVPAVIVADIEWYHGCRL